MATYAIGDIQGCFDALEFLLEKISFNPRKDTVWFAGDLVNRGDKSLETLRYIKSLGDSAVCVLGNHDLTLLAISAGSKQVKHHTMQDIFSAPDRDKLLKWLRHRPLLHHDKKLGYTMIHAGLPPQWDLPLAQHCAGEVEAVLRSDELPHFIEHMYGNKPKRWSDTLSGWGRLRFIINCFTRLRFCDVDGRLKLKYKGAPGSQPPEYLPWFELPGRKSRDMNIVFGHWSTLGPCSTPGIYPLDTACLWGGDLTALRIDGKPQRFTLPCAGRVVATA